MAKRNIDFGREFQEKGKNFYRETKKAITSNLSKIKDSNYPGLGFRMEDGLIFVPNPEIIQAEVELIQHCTRSLESKFGHEEEIASIAWKAAAEEIIGNDSETAFIENLKDSLADHVQQTFTVIKPNYLIKFEENIRRISIGPVTALMSEDLIASLPKNKMLEILPSELFKVELSSGKIRYELPPVIWRVEVNCARGYSIQEVVWNVDVAISLLRLHYEDNLSGPFPYRGDVEASPFTYSDGKHQELTLTAKGFSGGGWSIPRVYHVTDEISQVIESEQFNAKVQAIFNGNKKNLSSRVGQGLGWLTRGRRSRDRAERFLFFFTAIEALLSSQDTSAQVIQTIARRAAVMLADKSTDREWWASKIKRLYVTRSSLVHRGDREVSQTDANEAQFVAELLYCGILRKEDLTTRFSDFEKCLDSATYGSKWISHMEMRAIFNDTLERYEEALEEFFRITRGATQGNKRAAIQKRKKAFEDAGSKLSDQEFCKWKKEMNKVRGRVFSNLGNLKGTFPLPLSNGLVVSNEEYAGKPTGNKVVEAGEPNPTAQKLAVAMLIKKSGSPEKWCLQVNEPPFCTELEPTRILDKPLSEILDYLDGLEISKKQ